MTGDVGKMIVEERALLEKFDGDVESGRVIERIHFLNGVLEKHEWLENGKVVRVEKYPLEEETHGTD